MRDFHLFCSHWVGVLGGGLSPWVTRSEPPKDKIKRPEGHSTRSWVPEDLQTSSESIFLKRKHLSKFICEKLKKRRCVKHISESLDSQVYLPPTHAVSICRSLYKWQTVELTFEILHEVVITIRHYNSLLI